MNLTEQTKSDFLRLVVEKDTTACWSWAGDHDGDLRPVFRGEKAYRVMYELRVRPVPDGFHIHHKCGNSSCVNPRHLVALSPEAHRRVHATKDKSIQERIYRGEWEQIQAAEKAEAARLANEQRALQQLQWERYEKEQEEKRRQEEEKQRLTAEVERWRREHPWPVLWQRCRYLSGGLICAAFTYLLWKFTWSFPGDGWMMFFAGTMWIIAPLTLGIILCFALAFHNDVPAKAYERWLKQRRRKL